MSTSTWSAPRPRRVAGRTWSVPPDTVARGKFTLGASCWRIYAVSVRPVLATLAADSTSTGTGDSITERARARLPTTATASSADAARTSRKFAVEVQPAVITTARVADV
jgi:hypothetical protein